MPQQKLADDCFEKYRKKLLKVFLEQMDQIIPGKSWRR